jgi:hypothetical protein
MTAPACEHEWEIYAAHTVAGALTRCGVVCVKCREEHEARDMRLRLFATTARISSLLLESAALATEVQQLRDQLQAVGLERDKYWAALDKIANTVPQTEDECGVSNDWCEDDEIDWMRSVARRALAKEPPR